MRRILVAVVTAGLLLSGCSSDTDDGSLDSIDVSGTDKPTVKVDKGFEASSTTTRVITEGDGDKIVEGDAVSINYLTVNGRTGKQFDNSFTGGSPMVVTLSKDTQLLAGLVKGIIGQRIGSRFLVAIPPKDGFDAANDSLGLKADDTMIFLIDAVSKVPQEASGKKADLPDSVPSIVLDDDGHPSGFKAGKSVAKDPKTSSHVVIEGDGPKLEAGQTLLAQYVGQVYPDGAVFDESWSSKAASFQVGTGQVIKCWDDQLVGKKIGSRVVLVCPADVAYGDQDRGDIKAGDTLLFAVDLLAAS